METGSACPCGSGQKYQGCCEPYLSSALPAPTAEALMRSRYCAYVLADEEYLFSTWHVSTRPTQLGLDDSPIAKWLGLKILATMGGSEQDTEGFVEFVARYKINGKAEHLHENSHFQKEDDHWFYVDGKLMK